MIVFVIMAIPVIVTFSVITKNPTTSTTKTLPHAAYIWQRSWTPALKAMIKEHDSTFQHLIALGAEITFKNGTPETTDARVDYKLLSKLTCPIGLALRIGPYHGAFAADDENATYIKREASRLIRNAQKAGVCLSELQIDFDCATSKLNGYRVWVEMLRTTVDIPITITALPTWLESKDFSALASTSDGFVLQMHSLERPNASDAEITLCRPDDALRAATKASRIGVPFYVALPTYGYMLTFNSRGELKRVSAEGPAITTPGMATREVRSNARAMAKLVDTWKHARPDLLKGIIWYRFPSPEDQLNWKWITLESIIKGEKLNPGIVIQVQNVETTIWEITLLNQGNMDTPLNQPIRITWSEGRPTSADTFRGFTYSFTSSNALQITPSRQIIPGVLRPGEQRRVGWVRFNQETELRTDVSTNTL